MERKTREATYTYEQVVKALNDGADLVVDELQLEDAGGRDLINLLVNAIGAFLRAEDTSSLDAVIRASYETGPAEVRSWVEGL